MKYLYCITSLAALFLAAGCGGAPDSRKVMDAKRDMTEADRKAKDLAEQSVRASGSEKERLEREARKAEDEAKKKQRDFEIARMSYQSDMQAKLDELDRKAADWKVKMEKATGDAKKKMQDELDRLERHRVDVRRQWTSLKDASAETWEKLSRDTSRAYDELKTGFEKSAEQFK